MENEFKTHPDGIGVDVFFGGGPEPFLALASRHWLDTAAVDRAAIRARWVAAPAP